ncbi:UNVERIFIED_CONTAM: hypothetical protein Sindi_0463800 [Sesamum indicum]
MDQRRKNIPVSNRAAAAIEIKNEEKNAVDGEAINEMLRTEFHKFLGGLKPQTLTITDGDRYNFSGKTTDHNLPDSDKFDEWIIDSGSTSHLYKDNFMFSDKSANQNNVYVHLADVTRHKVQKSGDIKLNDKLILNDALFVPSVQFNLLSVNRQCKSFPIKVKFLESCCVMQDLKTREVNAVAKLVERLYILNAQSFDRKNIDDILHKHRELSLYTSHVSLDIWHKRLGHLSKNVFMHTGYAPNQKGYKVYDLKKGCMLISRDVTFHEDIFPYTDKSSDPISCSLPIVLAENDPEDIREHDEPTITEHDINDNQTNSPVVLRRSNRQVTQPAKFQDYICTYSGTDTDIPLAVPSSQIQKCYFTAINNPNEPKNFKEAMKDKEWIKAMEDEIRALEENETWEITSLPKDKKAIGNK